MNFLGAWGRAVYFVSGEWLLNFRPNGGDVILFRSLWASALLYLAFIALKHALDPTRLWTFSLMALKAEAHSSLALFGVLIGATYAALYARYSSQWGYLAGLYNQLLAADTKATDSDTENQKKALAYWTASFIEDAEELHLATKRTFAPAIRHWLDDPAIKAAFVDGALGGVDRLDRLIRNLDKAMESSQGGKRTGEPDKSTGRSATTTTHDAGSKNQPRAP